MTDNNDEFKTIIDTINADVAGAMKSAKEQGKPLLIVVGEDPTSPKSIVLDAAIIKIANDYGVKNFKDEIPAQLESVIDNLPAQKRHLTTDFTVPLAKKVLGMRFEGIEKNDETNDTAMTVEGVKRREDVMKDRLLKSDGDVVFTTGKTHLKAFNTDPEITKKFHVLAINESDSEANGLAVTDMAKLTQERINYANDPNNAKQYRLSDAVVTGQSTRAIFTRLLGGQKVAEFEQAINVPETLRLKPTNIPAIPTKTSEPSKN